MMLFKDLTENERELYALSLLNPSNPLFYIVGKRGLNEILGDDYDCYEKTIEQIENDIRERA